MSSYKNLTKIFPKRCYDLLKLYPFARWADREVTLMLTVASAGLTIPIERLEKKNYPYPFTESVRYPQAHNELDNFLAEKFCGSILLKNYPQSWCLGRLATTIGDPDSWTEFQYPQPMPSNKTVKNVVKHLRNALAHGSIQTKTTRFQNSFSLPASNDTVPTLIT